MLTFLIGGARSGKSILAVELADRTGRSVHFIATATPLDDDMSARIQSHRDERPPDWDTIEEPVELETALMKVPADDTLVIDCITLWVSNLLLHELGDDVIVERAKSAAEAARRRKGGTIVVSNEVGMGIHPTTPLGRRYRDLLGRVNKVWSSAADEAFLAVAGRILPLVTYDGVDRS